MEDGASSNLHGYNVTAVPKSGSETQGARGDENNPSGSLTEPTIEHAHACDLMPMNNVLRIMRRGLPEHAKIANDAKDKMQECLSNFIQVVTNEANRRCHQERRRTITGEDLIGAMGNLGMHNYVEPLTLYLNKYREHEFQKKSLPGERYRKRSVSFVQTEIPQQPWDMPTNVSFVQSQIPQQPWDMPTNEHPDGHRPW